MNLKDNLKKYFDEEIKKDSALAEKYDVQKIAECESYVIGEAKKYLHSQSGAIEDSIVFKWARDFFIDNEISKTEKKNSAEIIANKIEPKKQKNLEDDQLSFCFGE